MRIINPIIDPSFYVYMFGGECEIIYNPKFVWHEIHIRNDDVIHFYLTITRDFVYDFEHRHDI